jgi:hypothetical protein
MDWRCDRLLLYPVTLKNIDGSSAWQRDLVATLQRISQQLAVEGIPLKNPLDSLWGTVICGVILTVALYFLANAIMPHVTAGGT